MRLFHIRKFLYKKFFVVQKIVYKSRATPYIHLMEFHMDKKTLLENLCRIADGLVAFWGRDYEIAIHDLSRLESSLVHIAGEVTKRAPGAPATDFLINHLSRYGADAPDVRPYRAQGRHGEPLRGSLVYIKDDKGVPVFAMCINQNISRQMAAIAALEDQIRTAPAEDSRNDGTQETFAATSEETMEAIVRKVLQQFGKLPTELNREERIALIAQFDQHGAFRFKGMVEHIASIMGISKYTLYSYRKACRQGPANGPQDPELPS